MRKLITSKYKCSLCGKEFDKDNIILKEKNAPLCEKCYEKSISGEIEEEKSSLDAIIKGFEAVRLRMMAKGNFTEEVNEALIRCTEVVRKELG